MLAVAEKEKRSGNGVGGAPGTEGARRATGVAGAGAAAKRRSDPEVPEKAQRRRFTPEYKLRVLEEADRCRESGEIGALLRREGLYTSNLSAWREQRRVGALGALGQHRGRKPRRDPQAERVAALERENGRLREELRKAQVIIDVQKKVARLLGTELPEIDEER